MGVLDFYKNPMIPGVMGGRMPQMNDMIGIKSIQRGEKTLAGATTTDTVTITDVGDVEKAFVLVSTSYDANAQIHEVLVDVFLTNSTTLTFTRGVGANTVINAWQVVRFF